MHWVHNACWCLCWQQLELRDRQKRQQAEYEAQHPGVKVTKKKTYTDKYLEEFMPPPEPESVAVIMCCLADVTDRQTAL